MESRKIKGNLTVNLTGDDFSVGTCIRNLGEGGGCLNSSIPQPFLDQIPFPNMKLKEYPIAGISSMC
jgi:hypothetical protein